MSDRKFGKDEIQQILKKAAEKQQRSDLVQSPTVGLSLGEIERIAAEAGIDPRFVREAAIETTSAVDDRVYSKFAGGITSMELERVIPVDIPEDQLDTELIPVIRDVMGKQGNFEKLGNTITWTDGVNHAASYTEVQVSSRRGETEISASTTKNMKGSSMGLLIFPILFLLFTFVSLAKNGLDQPTIVMSLLFLTMSLATRFGYSWWARNLERNMDSVVDALENQVLAIGVDSSTEDSETSQSVTAESDTIVGGRPLLDLDSLDESNDDADLSSSRDRRRES